MNWLIVVFLVAVGWVGLRGRFEVLDIGTALFLGAALAAALRPRLSGGPSVRHLPWFLLEVARVAWNLVRELVESNLEQLRLVLRPRVDVRPHWIEIETELETPMMRALLAIMISMTPMTIFCDDRQSGGRVLLVHVLDVEEEAHAIERIRHKMERPLLALERLWTR